MGLRSWLGRAGAGALNLLVEFGTVVVGPLPGVNYPDPEPDPDSGPAPGSAPGSDPDSAPGSGSGLPAGHPERRCSTPPSRVEQELWAGLGVDVRGTGE
ncbi:DUF6059 family protein [Streptomyces sp. NPDC088124]|uniref:DUF6059 family protein n=1 Tax=Streptomyces sp. NPDC088124 TaxID=3154654 RepID=UPI00343D1029